MLAVRTLRQTKELFKEPPQMCIRDRDTSDSGLDLSEEILIDPDVHVKRDGSPVVLFYSTHTSEAYLQYESDWYYRDVYKRQE